jgi:hypothetical protein
MPATEGWVETPENDRKWRAHESNVVGFRSDVSWNVRGIAYNNTHASRQRSH